MLLDATKEIAEALKARIHASHLFESTNLPLFSKALVSQVGGGRKFLVSQVSGPWEEGPFTCPESIGTIGVYVW